MQLLIVIGVLTIFVIVRTHFSNKNRRVALYQDLLQSFETGTPLPQNIKKAPHAYTPRDFLLTHPEFNQLDEATWKDLHLSECYERFNHCLSSCGGDYFYGLLHHIGSSPSDLDELEQYISFFENHPKLAARIMQQAGELGYFSHTSISRELTKLQESKDLQIWVDLFLDFLLIPLIALVCFYPLVGMIGIFLLILINIGRYFSRKRYLEGHLASISYLISLIKTVSAVINIVKDTDLTTISSQDAQNRLNSYFESFDAIKKLARKGNFIIYSQKNGLGGASSGQDPAQLFLSYFNMIFHFDLLEYQSIIQQLRIHLSEIDCCILTTGYLESAINIAYIRKCSSYYCIPQFLDSTKPSMVMEDGIHPLITNAIPNSIIAKKPVLLTGSNASGKSTFLRMVGINAVFAQTINTVFAKEYIAPFFKIYSSIALQDNLFEQESYFLAEIHSLKRIMDESGDSPILCLVDEVLRGTNTVERISASYAILKSFVTKNIFSMAATHDRELTELLCNDYDNYHFSEQIIDGDVRFTYKLQNGPASSRNAILLLEQMGYDPEIIKQSNEMAFVLDKKTI